MSSLRSQRRGQNRRARKKNQIKETTGDTEQSHLQALTSAIRRVINSASELDALIWVSEETERLKEMFPHVPRTRIVQTIGEEAKIADVGLWLDGLEEITLTLAQSENARGEQSVAFAF
jgi:hypothetical protein